MAERVNNSAKRFVELHYVDKDGNSDYQGLRHMEEVYGVRDSKLDEAIPPDEANFVWSLFFNKMKKSGVSFQEIDAYQRISGVILETWEVDLLYIINAAYDSTIAEKMKVK